MDCRLTNYATNYATNYKFARDTSTPDQGQKRAHVAPHSWKFIIRWIFTPSMDERRNSWVHLSRLVAGFSTIGIHSMDEVIELHTCVKRMRHLRKQSAMLHHGSHFQREILHATRGVPQSMDGDPIYGSIHESRATYSRAPKRIFHPIRGFFSTSTDRHGWGLVIRESRATIFT